jgi:predicted secreted protein
MFRRLIAVPVALSAGLLFAACSSGSSSSETTTTAGRAKADVVVPVDSSGQPQQLKVGQTLDVELKSATGTNYSWSVKSGYDSKVVSPDGDPVSAPTKAGMPGAPQITTYRFRAVGAGSTTLTFELKDNSTGELGSTVTVPVAVSA